MPRIEMETSLPVSPAVLASELLTMEGVNDELSPILKMTAPQPWASKPISEWPVNSEIFSSRILLFGVMPIDLHRFKFESVHGMGFKESSKSLFNRHWSHERTIRESGSGATVKDVLHYTSQLGFLGYLFMPLYQAIFSHRHKRLKRKYVQGGE